jgi:hypothetical protein
VLAPLADVVLVPIEGATSGEPSGWAPGPWSDLRRAERGEGVLHVLRHPMVPYLPTRGTIVPDKALTCGFAPL